MLVLGAGLVAWRFRERAGRSPDGPSFGRIAEVAARARKGPAVIFVGLDGGDWELLDRYLAAGALPNLAALVQKGTGGALVTLHPPLSPLVWTTMMTGRSPVEHGILDFTRFHPTTGQKEPITSDERKEPAIWNMATFGGKGVAVFGLWATYPAEPVNGLLVSDRLFSFLYSEDAPPPGAVFPGARESGARDALRRAEAGVGYPELKAYLPWLSQEEYDQRRTAKDPYSHPVSALRRILVETRVYHQLALEAMARDQPDLAVVYLQGTDSIGHVFAPFAPPRQAEVSAADYERYHEVPERYFRYVDTLLGDYRQRAEASGAVIFLASDHGFLWDEGRPTELSSFAQSTAAKWHRKEGLYLLAGPGIAASPGHREHGSVDQVCASLLALLGLPPGVGLGGPPLPGVPGARHDDARYDYRVPYKPASLALASAPSGATQEALEKLKALGYIGAGESTSAPSGARGSTRTAGSYNNEGLIWKDRAQPGKAVLAFEKALALDPALASALWNLSDLRFGEGDFDGSDALLLRAFGNGLPEGTKFLIGRAIGYQRAGQPARSLKLVTEGLKSKPESSALWLFSGRYRIESGDCRDAARDFQRAIEMGSRDASAYASLGLAQMCAGDRRGARQSLSRSLEIDPEQPKVREYMRGL